MLSKRAMTVKPSATGAISSKVAELRQEGRTIIALHIGEPDFNTPENICAAGKKAIDDGKTKYTVVDGILPLRKKIAEKLEKQNGIACTPNEICVTVGAKQALQNSLYAVCDPGDEVIVPTPCWVSYETMIEMAGGVPVLVPANAKDFTLDVDAVQGALTPRTKAIIINTPNNPTGAVYSEESLRRLAALACERDFYIIADEIYEELLYGEAKHFSVASISPEVRERVITINGFSKAYAMTGWRAGYICASREIIEAAKAFQSQSTSCICSIAQYAALEALNSPESALDDMRKIFTKRRDVLYDRLIRIPGVSCIKTEGAFYLMPDISGIIGKKTPEGKVLENDEDVCMYLLEMAGVATTPGEAFHSSNHLRFSYSNSVENIEKGMDLIEDAVGKLV